MAKIIKVSPAVTPKRGISQIKTSRSTTTNPFKYSNFEGNTLQFADVFDGFEPKNVNKLKLIASSVAGSMNKLRTGITEPIKVFANKVKNGVCSAWNYATNTNFSDLPGIKGISEKFNAIGEGISGKISGINDGIKSVGKKMYDKTEFLHTDITDIGKMMSTKWNELVEKCSISNSKISANLSVSELYSPSPFTSQSKASPVVKVEPLPRLPYVIVDPLAYPSAPQ